MESCDTCKNSNIVHGGFWCEELKNVLRLAYTPPVPSDFGCVYWEHPQNESRRPTKRAGDKRLTQTVMPHRAKRCWRRKEVR